jgi:predicted membrane protein (TIGR00267 family)
MTMSLFRLLRENAVIRRYIIMNSLDGALTILGILIATFLAGVFNAHLIIVSSFGVIVSTGVSGIWGGYMAERAEKKKTRRELERHLLTNLSKTHVSKEMNRIAWFMGLANGLSSSIVSFIGIIPFFFASAGLLAIETAFLFSFILVFIMVFFLGWAVGKIAQESVLFHGLAMVSVGLVVGAILFLFELLKVI